MTFIQRADKRKLVLDSKTTVVEGDVGSSLLAECDPPRFAKADLTKYGAGRVAFRSLVARHLGDASVVE